MLANGYVNVNAKVAHISALTMIAQVTNFPSKTKVGQLDSLSFKLLILSIFRSKIFKVLSG
jgi:hypothetical protein